MRRSFNYFSGFKKSFVFSCILLLLLASINVFCQSATTSSVLKKCLLQEKERLGNKYIDEISGLDFGVSLVDRIDIRSEIDRLTTSRQEFAIRTNFNSFTEKKAQLAKHQSYVDWKKSQVFQHRNEEIYQKYKQLIRLNYLELEVNFVKDIEALLIENLNVTETMMSNGISFDLGEYISIKESILSNQEKQQSIRNELDDIYKELQIAEVNKEGWVSKATSDSIISQINSQGIGLKHKDVFDSQMRYLHDLERLESAKNDKILDFAQAKYTVRDDLFLQNRFTIGVGLNIPWRGSEKNAMSELRAKKAALTYEKEEEYLSLKDEWKAAYLVFRRKSNQLKLLQDIKNDDSLSKLKEKIIESQRLSPVKILKIKEEETELEMNINKTRYDLESTYILLLHISGVMYGKPYIDFLDNSGRIYAD